MRARRGPPPLHLLAAAIVLAACGACGRTAPASALDKLHPCTTDEGPNDAYCGTLPVFENRDARAGRRINLNIVVLPSLNAKSLADPLFFLAGGPGQAAAKMAPLVRQVFRPIQRDRDIVLVDQRGTGKSNPLDCRSETDSLRAINEPDEVGLDRLRDCLAHYDADVRFYTTTIAMDDLDDVREYLGYDRINLYGGSYGTRAALVYLRRHEPHVRTVTLDGVAPTNMRLPLFTARDAQLALDKMLAGCAADADCRRTYPDLTPRIRALLQRLETAPVRTRLVHPRTGVAEDVEVDARFVASVLFGALYSPLTASLLPALVDRAEHDDFQALLALAMANEQDDNMSVGMQLSVICSEDVPRIDPADRAREGESTVFRSYLMSGQMRACAFWPRGAVDASYYEPVTSDVPTLVLSGEADPVTPPTWGAEVASHLSRSRHLTAAATGHGVIGTPCGVRIIRDFIDRGSVDGLDGSCLQTIRRPPFFVTPSGPEPAPRAAQ